MQSEESEVSPCVLIGLLGVSAGVGSLSRSSIIAFISTPNSFSLLLFIDFPSVGISLSMDLPSIKLSSAISASDLRGDSWSLLISNCRGDARVLFEGKVIKLNELLGRVRLQSGSFIGEGCVSSVNLQGEEVLGVCKQSTR